MEKQVLPNVTLIFVFGILSILSACCCGPLGFVFGIIAFILSKKATTLYMENPNVYTEYDNVKIGNVLAIIGIVFNGGNIILSIIYVLINGFSEYQN